MLNKLFRICLDIKSNFNDIVKEYNLTFAQWQVLKCINTSTYNKLMISEIVENLNSDKATVSLLIKKLKEKNMVEVELDEDDKRKKYITLTDEMKANCLRMKKIEEEFTKKVFANLSEQEKAELEKILNKI